ncbi:MAG: ABC transporter permease [Myxococcales bacterium]|nr:ABC transporter permease [Myxococcales bacterium]
MRLYRHRTPDATFVGELAAEPPPWRPFGSFVSDLKTHSHALEAFALGRFRAAYRAQALGLLWPLANPTILMIVMSVFFGIVFPTRIDAYPVFLILGLIPWHFLSHAWTDGTSCFLQHAEVIKRTGVPAWIVAFGSVLSHVLNLAFATLSVLPLIAFYPDAFHVSFALLLLIPVLVCLVALGQGLALGSAVFNVVFRDVGYIVNSALVVLFWATPIFYPMDRLGPLAQKVMLLNPMAAVIQCIRDIVLKGAVPPPTVLGAAFVTCFSILLLGSLVYQRFARVVADHV